MTCSRSDLMAASLDPVLTNENIVKNELPSALDEARKSKPLEIDP